MNMRATVAQTYEHLKQFAVSNNMIGAVPLNSVRNYVGTLDENRLFHGEGVLLSEMGFRYEGAFVHGIMEGKGCMTWNNGVTYEGSFKRNAPHGSGLFTWTNGDSYLGDVKHGVPNGHGVFSAGNEMYNGSWLSGKRHGRGYQKYTFESFYDGEWKEDKRHGRGNLVYPNGDVYTGKWKNGKRGEFGTMGWKHGASHFVELYEGQWCEGVPHGLGRSTHLRYLHPESVPHSDNPVTYAHPVNSVANIYVGSYVYGKREGFGVFFYADGSTYEGEWRNDKKEGSGKLVMSEGTVFCGTFYGNEVDTLLKQKSELSSCLPVLDLSDLLGISHNSIDEANSSIRLLLLRYNNTLKNLFESYAGKCEDIMFITTPFSWWRYRVPGHICIPQYLRLLNDAHVINGHLSIRDVINCIVETIQKEDEGEQRKFGKSWSGRLQALCSAVLRLEGCLNYRQFVESIVRISAVACIGPNTSEVVRCFAALVEGPLERSHLTEEPLFPITREYGPVLLVPEMMVALERVFLRLITCCEPEESHLTAALSVHDFILFFRPMLDEAGITLTEALNHLFPFDRFKTPGVAPSAVCQPRNALGFSIYEKSCGPNGDFVAALVASERVLVFVEFIEAVLGAVRLLGATTTGAMQEMLHAILAEEDHHKLATGLVSACKQEVDGEEDEVGNGNSSK